MIFLGLILIGILIALRLAWVDGKSWRSVRDWGATVRCALGYSLVAVLVGGFVGMLASLAVYEATVDDVPRRFNIESLGDGAGVEGRMFLGSGSVDTEAVFFYYAPRKDGGYGLFHVDASDTAIYEDQTNSGYLIKYCADSWTAPDWLFGREDEEDRYECGQSERFEFHIPDNSIDRSFNLDAQ